MAFSKYKNKKTTYLDFSFKRFNSFLSNSISACCSLIAATSTGIRFFLIALRYILQLFELLTLVVHFSSLINHSWVF